MTDKALLAVVIASSVSLGVGATILFTRRERPIGLRRVGLCFAVFVFIWLVEVFGVRAVRGTMFLSVSLLYVHMMVVIPLLGIALLVVARRRPVTRPVRWIAALCLCLVPLGIDASFVEPYRLRTEHTTVELDRERGGSSALRIVVLADIQTNEVTDHERAAVARAMAVKPDLILVPGDLVQVGFDHLPKIEAAFRELLAPLDAPLGVFYVQGDCENYAIARRLTAGTRVRHLENEIVELVHGDRRLALCGVELDFRSLGAHAAIDQLLARTDTSELRILAAHRPDVALTLAAQGRVDLVVAGHTHGGQVQLPFLGPIITLSAVPRAVAAGGLHVLAGQRLYVSRGIGWERGHAPRMRFLCPPEVSVLDLVSKPLSRGL